MLITTIKDTTISAHALPNHINPNIHHLHIHSSLFTYFYI